MAEVIKGRRGRRKAAWAEVVTEVAVEQLPTYTPEEQILVDKYPTQKIVAGSLLMAGDKKGFPTKRSIEIRCQRCDKVRRIATSDCFQTKTCGPECKKLAKKEADAGANS